MSSQGVAPALWLVDTAPESATNPLANAHIAKSDILNDVIARSKAGQCIIPLAYGGKQPIFNWDHYKYSRPDWHTNTPEIIRDRELAFAGNCNKGVITGRISGNLVDIDCDDPQIFDENVALFKMRFGTVHAFYTSRGGHIQFHSSRGEIESAKLFKGDLLCAGGHIAVLPGSVKHDKETGAVHTYTLHEASADTIPTIDPLDITWLRDENNAKYTPKVVTNYKPTEPKSYTPETLDYLENGHKLLPGSRHDRLKAAAWEMLGHGNTPAYIEQKLRPIASITGLTDRQIDKALNHAFKRYDASKQKSQSKIMVWHRAFAFGEQHNWPRARKDKDVFFALVRCCEQRRTSTFIAPERQLAKYARCTPKTAITAVHRLRDAGLIVQTNSQQLAQDRKERGRPRAARYRFTQQVTMTDVDDSLLHNYTMRYYVPEGKQLHGVKLQQDMQQPVQHNPDTLRERKALGSTGYDIYMWICRQIDGVSNTDIAAQFKVHRSTVSRHVNKIESKGLIYKDRDGNWRGQRDTTREQQAILNSDALEQERAREARIEADRQAALRLHIIENRVFADKNMPQWALDLFNASKADQQPQEARTAPQMVEQGSLSTTPAETAETRPDNILEVEFTAARDKPAAGD